LLSGAVSPLQARQTEPMRSIEGLGTISFPTSTRSAAAQTAFLRGALLLHLFEYPDRPKPSARRNSWIRTSPWPTGARR
jgi:hypothetical protein